MAERKSGGARLFLPRKGGNPHVDGLDVAHGRRCGSRIYRSDVKQARRHNTVARYPRDGPARSAQGRVAQLAADAGR